MLEHGEILRYVPNWWNPYAPNVGQPDPARKHRVLIIIKIIIAVITMLGGATMAICINLLVHENRAEFGSSSIQKTTDKAVLKPLPLAPHQQAGGGAKEPNKQNVSLVVKPQEESERPDDRKRK